MNATNNQTPTYKAANYFNRWHKIVLTKYKKIKAKKLIELIRKDRGKR